ncbi:glutamate--tRNA ligase [Paenibacillus baekrokdamisoli]|uniref:Glutamate--tRNA ligase n=1 Tax=Paenibacillus baekrokdamisoli TaxID=1712516 RepID=A0A3G9JM48_9BACL|nr:glutamate--tRNA ligase [Paenibacillus baekrokdamisoli]MBB3073145.1 nondiscriminating glutamyl-tRNA synthetase [Paenibacillus baekrokdamisoli]BBH23974.1 glutamate--tRNA ligase [Paenibacillus baekrokdamisoli]
MTQQIRVRYAPSPTGHLHIGNARTALFNYLFARNLGGKFIIRIEDTDIKRNVAGGEESQLTYLKWLGIDWDESVDIGGGYGPYRQTERLDIYREYWQDLIDRGLAYKCYCTEAELEEEREEQTSRGETPRYSGKHRDLTEDQRQTFEAEGRVPSIRFRVPEGKTYSFNDLVKGQISFETEGTGDFVIVKKDGIPTYNFAVALDDHLMAISHVLRGEDHISNTPRQLMIYEAFGWEPPIFGHMTLIVNDQRKKLSKRDESIVQFIEQYDKLGYLPEAMFNFITLLGWSPEGEQEIFTRDELVQAFDSNRLSKSPAVFDSNKLRWMNNEYLKKTELPRLVDLCVPQLQKAGRLPDEIDEAGHAWASALIALYQDKLHYAAEIVPLTELFFNAEVTDEEEAKAVLAEEQVPVVLQAFADQLAALDTLEVDGIKAAIKAVQQSTGFKGKQLFMPIRAALTGQTHGPDLNQTIALLGKSKVVERIQFRLG